MARSLHKIAHAAVAMAALGLAAPASAAMQLNSNGTVSVTGTSGGAVTLNMNGFGSMGTIAGLTSTLTLGFQGVSNGVYTFTYALANTSSAPVTASRLNGFGFNTNPTFVANGATITPNSTSNVVTSISYGRNLPNGIGKIDVCFTAGNCTGGGSDGIQMGGAAETGVLTLNFGNQAISTLTLSDIAVRYQAINVPSRGLSGESATGLVVTTAVPEPGTWALMLLGFGTIGFGMRRRRVNSILQMA